MNNITEITRAIIAIIIVVGAVVSVIFYPVASQVMLTLAGIVMGYYFKGYEQQVIAGAKKILGIGPKIEQ